MSIEKAIEALTAAIEANTAAILTLNAKSGEVSSTADAAEKVAEKTEKSSGRGRGKPGSKATSKYTKEEVQAALLEVKEQLGTSVAKQIIADAGFAKMADITADKYDEVYEAAKKALKDDDDEGGEGEGI